MTGSPELPIVILVVIGVPLAAAFLLGWIELRQLTPLVFWCQRCGREFRQPPQRRFPRACPRCRSREWNTQLAHSRCP